MVWIHCQREKYGIFFRYNMWLLKIATCINVTLTSMSFSLLFFRTNFLAFIHLLFFFNARMWRLCRCRRWLKGRDAAASACAGRQYWSQENYRLGCAGRQCPVIFRTHKFGAMSKCRCQMCLKWCHFGAMSKYSGAVWIHELFFITPSNSPNNFIESQKGGLFCGYLEIIHPKNYPPRGDI